MREILEIEKLISLLEKLETPKSTNIKTEIKQMTAPIPVKYYKYYFGITEQTSHTGLPA